MQKTIIPFLALVLTACTPSAPDKSAARNETLASDTFKASLTEKPLDESRYSVVGSRYYLSLPANYVIEPTFGEDFTVYYFHPADTTLKNPLAGGIYFGNHPSPWKHEKTETQKAPILGKTRKWDITVLDSVYNIQTVFKYGATANKNSDMFDHIHAFGWAQSQAEIARLLDIFATLRKNE